MMYNKIEKNENIVKHNEKNNKEENNKEELMAIIIYILLVVTYVIHFTNVRNNTYPVFVTLYAALCLCYLYSKMENEINYSVNIGITYALLSMMYVYHMKNKSDSNYIVMGIIVFATTVFKYLEAMPHIHPLTLNTPFVMGIISLLYIKHGIIQSEYDYLVSSIMYGLLVYTMI